MPSRKRNKGKERKAKKEAIAAKNDDMLAEAVNNTWRGWALGEDALSDEKIIHCDHGCDVTAPTDRDHPVCCFMNSFMGNKSDWVSLINSHPQIWDDDNYRNMAVHILTRIGINNLLLINDHLPTNIACTIMILENYNEAMTVSEVFLIRRVASKVRDLQGSNDRDLYKFFSKRVSCACLKDAYSYARKTLPKIGRCHHCDEIKERKLLSVCSQCGIYQYCSRECHVAHWPDHEKICDSCGSLRKRQARKEDKDQCVIS